ncbi:MAG: NUDIX domain-containing protein [Spirochaetota bacterium]|nr:MAG: NUDIX domain-containing protein [Spirochaetota bacterium]
MYDERRNPTGRIGERSKVHSEGLWHRTVHIWIYKDNSLLLQMRSKHKESFPGLWDVSAAGHVETGEEPLTTAIREIKEELGFEVHTNLIRFVDVKQFSLTSQNGKFINNEITHIFTHEFRGSLNDIVPNPFEVEQLKFFDIDHLENLLGNSKTRKEFVPYDNSYYKWILRQIKI